MQLGIEMRGLGKVIIREMLDWPAHFISPTNRVCSIQHWH